jgi:hypothetical protein
MATQTIPAKAVPALADVSKDIAGPLSVSLLRDWSGGERTQERAIRLLAPYRREGIVVSSDTSGLSKLTQERDLLDVLRMVSKPKQIIHAIGTAIGGEAIGVWVADNTEMFYRSSIDADAVAHAMIEAQARIATRASVMIGLCLHTGVFYEIGGGLYGPDARCVELLAEDYARAQEILVTDVFAKKLSDDGRILERREDLDPIHPPGVFALRSSRRFPELREESAVYPHGFPDEFFSMVCLGAHAASHEEVAAKVNEAHQVERFVVFLARKKVEHDESDLASVLDDFVADARMAALVAANVDVERHVVESGGGLAILVFESGREALDFARRARKSFQEEATLEVKLGLDHGAILLFTLSDGTYGNIAGDPVNLASKISEDLGQVGRINITSRAAALVEGLGSAEHFDADISRVHIDGLVV